LAWPLRLLHLREGPEGKVFSAPAVSETFLVRLLGCPACRHLRHLGSDFTFGPEQVALVRSLGVEPVSSNRRWWMHEIDPRYFRRPALR
jgi:hypothetical protein